MESQNLDWTKLTALFVSGMVSLPVMMVGYSLGLLYGEKNAILAIFVGNGLLFLLALVSVRMSLTYRLTTAECAYSAFGKSGEKFYALILTAVKCFWFALQLNMVALALPGLPFANLVLGILMVGVVLLGLTGIARFSTAVIPLLIGGIAYAMLSDAKIGKSIETSLFSLAGISIVVATAIARVVDMPTFFRHCRTLKDGYITVFILFLVALPLVECVGLYFSMFHSETNLIEALHSEGSALWKGAIALFLLIAAFSANNVNLYSAETALKTLILKRNERERIILVGVIGVACALAGILDYFLTLLQVMGILMGTMGSVILTCFFLKKEEKIGNASSWILGAGCGIAFLATGISVTGAPVIDGCFIAMSSICLCHLLLVKEKREIAL